MRGRRHGEEEWQRKKSRVGVGGEKLVVASCRGRWQSIEDGTGKEEMSRAGGGGRREKPVMTRWRGRGQRVEDGAGE